MTHFTPFLAMLPGNALVGHSNPAEFYKAAMASPGGAQRLHELAAENTPARMRALLAEAERLNHTHPLRRPAKSVAAQAKRASARKELAELQLRLSIERARLGV